MFPSRIIAGMVATSIFLTLSGGTVIGQIVFTPTAKNRATPEEFTILPWGISSATPEALKDIYECGFNLAGFTDAESLDRVAAAGLKTIVIDNSIHANDSTASMSDDEITSRVNAVASRTAAHPALYGYYLRDEPGIGMFPCLSRWTEAVRKAAPRALPYINLFPNYVGADALANGTYDNYLDVFARDVKTGYLSYDHYALMDDGSLRGGYYANLDSARRMSLKHGIPFWNIVLSNAHFTYAEPSPAGLRFQVYTTLAYGARGISYFTYFCPPVGNYRLAPIDQFGHKTPTWEMLRNVNLQIHALAPVYTKLVSRNVFHHPNLVDGCNDLTSSLYLKDVTGGDFVVGEFEDETSRPCIILVNKSLKHSAAYSVAWKDEGTMLFMNPYEGRVMPWGGENCWLAPGQGVLLILERKKPE